MRVTERESTCEHFNSLPMAGNELRPALEIERTQSKSPQLNGKNLVTCAITVASWDLNYQEVGVGSQPALGMESLHSNVGQRHFNH